MKKLSFKGDTAPKKRKRTSKDPSQTSTAKTSTVKTASTDTGEDVDGWVDAESLVDINGPIFILFQYDSAVSLASDVRGSLFTIPLDSSTPTLNSAEPSDVRQVFIASPLVFRPSGAISLKNGGSGKYVSTSREGTCRCERDAIGVSEEWTVVKRPDGWSLVSKWERYMSIDKDGRVICASEDIGFCETFKIRIQARNRQKRVKETNGASVSSVAGARGSAPPSKKELEGKCGRTLSFEEVDDLRQAHKDGTLGEAILDMRVKGRSDKFG